MSTWPETLHEDNLDWRLPSRGQVEMYCLISAEAAIFTIFVVAYLFYIGKNLSGPKPKDVLHAPIFFTVCLLSVSAGIKRPRFRRFCGQRNPAIGQDAVPTLQQFLNLPT
jgi:cytochrome c oxidase subunit 3/cytochrome o ubiquinol oxidase subunit 3